MSQSVFANIFDLARPSVGAYEEGRAEPKIETVIQMARHFQLSIDTLLTKELTINELYKFDIFKNDIKNEEISTIDKDSIKEHTPLVTLENDLDYIVNHDNRDFINNLPLIQFPYTQTKKSRAFQINGSEMEYENCGLHHKDILLCSPISDYDKLKKEEVYVIVTQKKLVARRFKSADKKLTFKCDNPSYDDLVLGTKEINELWLAEAYFSHNLIAPTRVEERMGQFEKKLARIELMLNKK